MEARSDADLTLEGVVHDLNNIFETISEAAALLSSDPKWTAVAGSIQRSANRGHRMVADLAGPRLGACEVRQITESAVQFTRDYLETTHGPLLEFELHIDDGLRLRGMAAAWERVFVNLFINAAQAMEHGGLVRIDASGEAGTAAIMVTDNGPGIPDEYLPRIFEPHFSTKSSPGLGLHIVHSIVSRHGGVVRVANRSEGTGAAFLLEVPAG